MESLQEKFILKQLNNYNSSEMYCKNINYVFVAYIHELPKEKQQRKFINFKMEKQDNQFFSVKEFNGTVVN